MAGHASYAKLARTAGTGIISPRPAPPPAASHCRSTWHSTRYRSELGFPGSPILAGHEKADFPSPPSIEAEWATGNPLPRGYRAWYYCQPEVFARHLARRLLATQQWCPLRWSEAALRDVLDVHEVYDALIQAWYESLPPDLALPSSAGDEAAGMDELCILLRDRYLSMQELLCRPLVRLAPNQRRRPGPVAGPSSVHCQLGSAGLSAQDSDDTATLAS
ncbi:hypothetical protein CSAL01_13081 [Colletotrichum salicis]|uniref:Uncharacterized protein n=1 Tax=Colletotrichum salicis TaxID=1209931 RepID=A0A135UZT7_9PEZI|nr:hypothetical protein CSAL01_13081 [Colletotrichum salicis]